MNEHRNARRSIALLTLIGLLLALSACAKSKESLGPTYKGILTVWAAPGLAGYSGAAAAPSAEWFAERARAYETLHSDIKVEVRLLGSPEELETALTAPALSQPGPDLVFGRFLPELAPRLAEVEYDLLPPGAVDDYLPNALDAFRKNGKLHGLPALLEVQVLALNEQAFADAGVAVPEDGVWSLAEFEDRLKRLSGSGRFGLGFSHLPGYHEWYPLASGVLEQGGAIAADSRAGLERLVSYRREGLLHPDTAKVKAEETWKLFAAKQFAVMPAASWAIPLLRSEPYNVKLTVAGFPGDRTTGYTYGLLLFRQEDAVKLRAAADLAQFFAAPDQLVRLSRDTGLMPARKRSGNPFEGDPQLTRAWQLAAHQRPLPAGPVWDKAEPLIARELLYALIGAKAPDVALEAAREHITSATTSAGR